MGEVCMLCEGALVEEDRKPGRPMCACLLIGRDIGVIQDNAYTQGRNDALEKAAAESESELVATWLRSLKKNPDKEGGDKP